MTDGVVNQLFHGYRRGHQLLAGSVRLEAKSADLVARLSDLSGSASAEADIQPYITAYPLPCGKFYAIAKTWLDEDAPRDGCVLTHTLLLDPEFWATLPNPRLADELFVRPSSVEDTGAYQKSLQLSTTPSAEDRLQAPRREASVEFVARYFGEGLRPVVWFGEPHAEDVFWFVVRSLWASLRKEFACCTLSLQPRSLDDRGFDLLLAPLFTRSRFLKVSRENVVDASTQGSSARASGRGEEPWHQTLANIIFGGEKQDRAASEELEQFSPLLAKDPTAIRSLFLIETLRERVKESPTAAIGLMDLVETLAPSGKEAAAYKQNLLATALRAADVVRDAGEALKCYFLIGERLGHPAFRHIPEEIEHELYTAIARRTAENPEAALQTGERLFVPHAEHSKSSYAKGVVAGLSKLVSGNPSRLAVLHRFPVAAASIIMTEPMIARGYMRGMKELNKLTTAEADLVTWLASQYVPATWASLQSALLPEIEGDDDLVLAEELLARVEEPAVADVLETLRRTTGGFASSRINQLIAERVSKTYPKQVRRWGETVDAWSEGAADIVASTYSDDADGFGALVREPFGNFERKAQVIASFVRTVTWRGVPFWFREYARRDAGFLVPMLSLGKSLSPSMSEVVGKILQEVRDVPVAATSVPIEKVVELQSSTFAHALNDRILRSAIGGYMRGDITRTACDAWLSQDWAAAWLDMSESWDLVSLITGSAYESAAKWERAWLWVSDAPDALYRRKEPVLPQLVESLVAARRHGWKWNDKLTKAWVATLQQSHAARQNLAHVYLCAHALDYAFNHQQYPLGALVAETFGKVYGAVMNDPSVSPRTNIIFSIMRWIDRDWDKGKDLRKKLVAAFMDSGWSPGDLALAAGDASLLRKVFKRIMRRSDGERYVAAMLKDLRARKDPRATATLFELAELAKNPNFSEAWY